VEEILKRGLAAQGLPADPAMLAAFQGFYARLEEANRVMNLTAISGEADTARLHFLDCTAVLTAADLRDKTVIDVGTGAGFPGVPLLIACPEMTEMTLLDSLGKRVDFLRETCAALGLARAKPLCARAEELPELRERFDAAVSRAVARLRVLCELALPFVRPGGAFIAMKGPRPEEEIAEAAHAIETLGGALERVMRYTIPDTETTHSLVVIRKQRATPARYPRRFAQIKKTPL